MADGDFIELAETTTAGRRLGRHVEHDARSRNFPAAVAPIADVKHVRHGKPFDQGDLGSCTGNAMAGALMTAPYYTGQPHARRGERGAALRAGDPSRPRSGQLPAR